jgi:phospholipid/cholesterol/gamma-HCH transport system permease protein
LTPVKGAALVCSSRISRPRREAIKRRHYKRCIALLGFDRKFQDAPDAFPLFNLVNPRTSSGIKVVLKLTHNRAIWAMSVSVQARQEGDHASLVLAGPFDLPHAMMVAREVDSAEASLHGSRSIDVDLAGLDRIDGSGAVLLARLLDRLNEGGRHARIVEGSNAGAASLIALYRERRTDVAATPRSISTLTRIGEVAAGLPGKANEALDFGGRCAIAVPKAIASPNSVDWRSLPRLIQEIGADGLLVAGAANLLVGVIIGFLGVSQLGRFGAVSYVPELIVVTHFRELGPLVTAIVVAGRSGAGIASEIATMKVSEEVDALRSMGFDPVRWLAVPRCLALALTVPLMAWVGDVLALVGGLGATTLVSDITARAYVQAALKAITVNHFIGGLIKTPFLGLAIGLIACGQGLLARGGAAAVGARTTSAVVQSIFSVIVISAVFTFFLALIGI